MDISRVYTKKRSSMGAQPMFSNMGPVMLDSIVVQKAEYQNYILRNPIHREVQYTKPFSEKYVNTYRSEKVNIGVNHAEGGWPKEISFDDQESTQRHRRRIEKDEGYIKAIANLAPDTEYYILQNNAIDLYRKYFNELDPSSKPEIYSVRTVNAFRDKHTRPISSIAWMPDGAYKFCVTYSDFDFYLQPRRSMTCYQWNINKSLEPEYEIKPPAPMVDLQYSNRDPNLMAGALTNGQVAFFDNRAEGTRVQLTSKHTSHRCLVRNIIFSNQKTGREVFSGGRDGACKWWDLRNLSQPFDEIIMSEVKFSNENASLKTALGISVLEFEPTIPTRFTVGTENGYIMGGNRKGKTQLERVPYVFPAHLGPVWSLQRNPNFVKNFLTVGDWTAKVWSEECHESPIIWTPNHPHNITGGTWSPTRISMMALIGSDGKIAIWDLLRKCHEPALTKKITAAPLLQLKFHEAGSLLAVGSSKGEIVLLEMNECLAKSGKNDKVLMTHLLEREAKRERFVEARTREIKLRQRSVEEAGTPRVSFDDDDEADNKDLAEATLEYMTVVTQEKSRLHF